MGVMATGQLEPWNTSDQWRISIVKFWTRPSPPAPPPSNFFFIFMQFSGEFGQIIGRSPFRVGDPREILDPPLSDG